MKWVHLLEDCLEELYVKFKKAYAFLVQIGICLWMKIENLNKKKVIFVVNTSITLRK